MEHRPRGGQTPSPAAEDWRFAALTAGHDTLVEDSAGQVKPRYLVAELTAGRLTCGELVLEPVLGPVRVTAVNRLDEGERSGFVQLAWADDQGPSRAAGCYLADQRFPVRLPDPADRFVIDRSIERAQRMSWEVPGAIARLVAAHLHLGPFSALYGFAVRGAIPDALYDELDEVKANRPVYRPWVDALARFCLAHDDGDPIEGWGPDRRKRAATALQPRSGSAARSSRSTAKAPPDPLTAKQICTETARQLIDAAFALGLAASRTEVGLAKARWVVAQHAEGAL